MSKSMVNYYQITYNIAMKKKLERLIFELSSNGHFNYKNSANFLLFIKLKGRNSRCLQISFAFDNLLVTDKIIFFKTLTEIVEFYSVPSFKFILASF